MPNTRVVSAAALGLLLAVSGCRSETRPGLNIAAGTATNQAVIRRVWAGSPEPYQKPSRDGRYVGSINFEQKQVLLRDLASGTIEAVKTFHQGSTEDDHTPYEATPSPDGALVAFLVEQGPPRYQNELRVISREATGERKLFTEADGKGWPQPEDWTRDGRNILMLLYGDDGGNQLYLISADGSSKQLLKSFAWRVPRKPTLSPDDRYIAYSSELRRNASVEQVHILDMQTGSETKVGPAREGTRFLGWSPDGNSILYTTNDDGLKTIWRLHVKDGRQVGQPLLVKRGLPTVEARGSTARGVLFGGTEINRVLELASIDFETATISGVREIANHPGSLLSGKAWSADGDYLAYARWNSASQPHLAVIVRSLRTGESREIVVKPPLRFNWIWSLRWDDNGKNLLFIGRDRANDTRRYRLPLATGIPVPEDEPASDSVRLSKDGRIRFITTRGTQTTGFATEDVATGRRVTIMDERVENSYVLSPDENRVITHVRNGESKEILLAEVQGDQAGHVTRFPAPADLHGWHRWTSDGRYVLFVLQHGTTRTLGQMNVATGQIRTFAGYSKDALIIPQLSVHGRQILIDIMASPPAGELWLIDEKAGAANGN